MKNENANDDITWNNSVGGSINWTIGYTGLTFTTDANYNWYNGYKTDQPSRLIWNAGLQMPIIYNSATIALNAYDMLGQRQNLSRNETGNYLSESRSLCPSPGASAPSVAATAAWAASAAVVAAGAAAVAAVAAWAAACPWVAA